MLRRRFALFVLCTLAFLTCLLLTVTPLVRMPDTLLRLRMAWGAWLGAASSWLPANLGPTYQPSSASIEFFCLITLAFCCYLLGAWLVRRWPAQTRLRSAQICIWAGALLAGVIYVLTPGVLSHDTMVYAGYSRLLAVYHANPYFVPFTAFPRDPLMPVDQWASVNALYGPIWLLVCALLGFVISPTPEAYLLAFRLLALAAHLLNIWLVARTLSALGAAPRTRAMGMLLYGWSPLVLLESALSGHNDVFMLTFVLLGVWLAARAEQRGILLRARGYLPPVAALTLAALVKFVILPALAVYLLFLLCRTLRPTADEQLALRRQLRHWPVAARVLGLAALVALLVALACYLPFWLGHSLRAIIASFADNPAASFAENSFMRSVINWLPFHPAQQQNPLLRFLSLRRVWDIVNYLAIILCLLVGTCRIWRNPAVRAMTAWMLAVMSVVLLLTPWFFTWYITWIVGLAAVSLPALSGWRTRAFFALALTFSYSALTLYLFNHNLLGSRGYLVSFFDIVPPCGAFVLCLVLSARSAQSRIRKQAA
jgi:hypothetical protein